MPRRAAADFAPITTAADGRLKPPPDLDRPEAALFASYVLAHPPGRFSAAHMPMLCAYVRACVDEEVASGELRAGGYVIDGKPSPWLAVQKEARRAMTTLESSLRASRQPIRANEVPEVSYYTRMSLLESRHDDDPN
jgi:hypothetical protein